MKKFKVGDFFEVTFKAGRSCDEFGRATPFWTGFVQCKHDGQKYSLWAAQTHGTGGCTNTMTSEEITSLEEVNKTIKYFNWLETHYKKVYGE